MDGKLTVEIALALLSDAAPTLLLVLFQDLDRLQGLHDLAVNAAAGINVLRGPRATVLGGAVYLATLRSETQLLSHRRPVSGATDASSELLTYRRRPTPTVLRK